ncbi:type II toxin-antitoxin system RelE family toxin (plasmid) [Haloferacaceae archaeon DSL9]
MAKAEVEYSQQAADQLEDLERETATRIVSKLDDVVWKPDHFLKRLSGSEYYRLRVGDYRVIIDWKRDESPEVLFVRRLGHRRNIYD